MESNILPAVALGAAGGGLTEFRLESGASITVAGDGVGVGDVVELAVRPEAVALCHDGAPPAPNTYVTEVLSAWLLYLLATNPAYLTRVRTDIDEIMDGTDGALTLQAVRAARALSYAVDEAGRLRSPVCNAPRVTVRAVEFGGYAIPEGTRVLLGLAAGHRLPHVFADPDRFDPDRFAPPRAEDKATPYSLVTFGGGPRVCIGMSFARVEIVAMAMWVLRSYTLTPIEGQALMHRCDGIIASLPHGLSVHVTAR